MNGDSVKIIVCLVNDSADGDKQNWWMHELSKEKQFSICVCLLRRSFLLLPSLFFVFSRSSQFISLFQSHLLVHYINIYKYTSRQRTTATFFQLVLFTAPFSVININLEYQLVSVEVFLFFCSFFVCLNCVQRKKRNSQKIYGYFMWNGKIPVVFRKKIEAMNVKRQQRFVRDSMHKRKKKRVKKQ